MSARKNASPETPPTVLVITLESDGGGSLLVRRGELAHLSQFTYQGMAEIVAAIQSGAEALITVEQNPPIVDVPLTQPNVLPANEDETTPADSAVESFVEQAAEPTPSPLPAHPDPLAVHPEPQPKLM